ncbi:MAG: phenylalanine--tRNA ligase subunit alpha, partial [Ignavibacteriaceae bacterium]|nr:phenylalanine--tRNA ligase subunit alpha [Ignavibacteriaceae bacterium]
MIEKIEKIKIDFENDVNAVVSVKELEDVRIKYLSRNGSIASLFEELKSVPKEEKPALGKELNSLRNFAQTNFDIRKEGIEKNNSSSKSKLDLSLPGREYLLGNKHILTQTLNDIKSIFKSLGFSVKEGPELESDYYNFEALNFPANHPARDMQDTFFVSKDFLLRTHTTPVQIRIMEKQKPPIRAIMPGKVFRNEAVSARSYCLFHQVDGIYIDEN